MTRLVLALFMFGVTAFADTPGTMTVGFFDGNVLAIELTGGAVSEISGVVTSSKNIQCDENACRFDFDINAKAQRPRLNIGEAGKKDQIRIAIESTSRGLSISMYSANGDPNRGTLVQALYKFLEENSKLEKSKIKGELITNHDYAFEGTHLRCTSYVSGDYLCEMKISRAGLTRN